MASNVLKIIYFLLLTISLPALSENKADPVIKFQQALFINSETHTPPDSSSNWKKVDLPDRRSQASSAWYRVDFIHNRSDDYWGVYLRAVSTNAVIWLNGERIGDGGQRINKNARNWHRPLYFKVIKSLLKQGKNSLHIQQIPLNSGYGALSHIYVGPDNLLKPIYEQRYYIKQTLIITASVILFSFGIFISLFWFKRRKNNMYGWFAAACFSWAFIALNMVVKYVPISERLWDSFIIASANWVVISMIMFLHRFWKIQRKQFEFYLLWLGIIETIIISLHLLSVTIY